MVVAASLRVASPAAAMPLLRIAGRLLAESGGAEEACKAFRRARAARPGGPDGPLQPDTLSEMGREHDAVRHWKAYLQPDSLSERAPHARRQLA